MLKCDDSGTHSLVCDWCSTVLCEGRKENGRWKHRFNEPAVTAGARRFCARRCALVYCATAPPAVNAEILWALSGTAQVAVGELVESAEPP